MRVPMILLFVLLAASPVLAQHAAQFSFDVAAPQGEFADSVDDPGFGVGAAYGYEAVPRLSLGAGFGFLIYGQESRRMSLPLVEDFDIKTNNNIADAFLLARYDLLRGRAVPYLEGRIGLRYLWTESHIEDDDWWDDDDAARQVNSDDLTDMLSYGGGLRIHLSDGGEKFRSVELDLRAMYSVGGEAEYLTEGSISVSGDRVIMDPSESKTDLMRYSLGVVLNF